MGEKKNRSTQLTGRGGKSQKFKRKQNYPDKKGPVKKRGKEKSEDQKRTSIDR